MQDSYKTGAKSRLAVVPVLFFFFAWNKSSVDADAGSIPDEDAEVSEKQNSIRNAGCRAKSGPRIRQAECNAITGD